jgi:hypothetical protein
VAATTDKRSANAVSETIDLITAYAKQETIGPLKGIGRWLALGAAGAIMLGLGTVFLALALLRVLQEECNGVFDGNWSWAPYFITLAAVALVIAFAVSRIRRTGLPHQKESR